MDYTAKRTLRLSNSKEARPYMLRFRSLSLVTWPSVWPLLYGKEIAATIAALSRCSPVAKLRNSGNPLEAASSNHGSSASAWPSRRKLEGIGYGFVVPVFFITSGLQLELHQVFASPLALLRVPVFLVALLVVRGM